MLATRARWTAQTYATSDKARAIAGPPLEMLFKGGPKKHEQLLGELARLRDGGSLGRLPQVSVGTSRSGSYAAAEILHDLDFVLE